jgi:hydroxypyruvate isomerase
LAAGVDLFFFAHLPEEKKLKINLKNYHAQITEGENAYAEQKNHP